MLFLQRIIKCFVVLNNYNKYEIDTETPFVSVLVPVWNVEKYIERCVRSLFGQTYQNLEYIFVDDCSPDQSVQIIERIVSEFPNRKEQVRIIHHEQNRGLSAARNTAVSECIGDFVFHVDSDDWVELNAIELLVKKQHETNADIVTGRAYSHTLNNIHEYCDGGYNLDRDDALLALLDNRISHSIWRRLIRISLYKEHHIRCIEGINIDEDFQVVVPLFFYSKKVAGISDFVYHYNRMNRNSYIYNLHSSTQLQDQHLKSVLSLVNFFYDKEIYKDAVEKCKVRALYGLMRWSVLNGNRKRYNHLKEQLYLEVKYWPEINWDVSCNKIIESNYYLSRIIIPMRMVMSYLKYNSFGLMFYKVFVWIKTRCVSNKYFCSSACL